MAKRETNVDAALSFALELLKVQQVLLYAHSDQIRALRRALVSAHTPLSYEQALHEDTAERPEDWQSDDVVLRRLEEMIQQLRNSV